MTIDGTLLFSADRDAWPKDKYGKVYECIEIHNLTNSIITSNGKGTLDGNGKEWWWAINYLIH